MLKYYINLVHFPRYFATGNACKSRFLLIFHFCFQRFCTEYRKDRSSGQSYAFCTLLTCCSWWSATNWFLMPIWTTLRSMGFADPQILLTSAIKCPSASMRFQLGWHPIDCSWITPKLKFSGAHLLVDNIRSRLVRSALAPFTCSQFLRPVTSGSTSTLTCPWGPTSQPSSERASRLYVRSGACGDLCHDTPCWPWFVHW